MPAISIFYGIIIYLHCNDNKQHFVPHIHDTFQDDEVVYDISTSEVLAGSIPISKHRLVMAWIELHRDELLADWKLAVGGNKPFRINPLI